MRTPLLLSLALLWACATPRSATPSPAPGPVPSQPAAKAEEVEVPAPPPALERNPLLPPRPFARPKPLQTVLLPSGKNPIVSFRLVFQAGSVDDPVGKEGLTALTATVLEEGGTQALSSAQLLEALFPMAAELASSTTKEFTVFEGRVHQDHLDRFLPIFTDVLLRPRFDPKEFARLKTDALNVVRNTVRSEDDEVLGKLALDELIYAGHPYRHFVGGTVQGLSAITLEDVKAQAKRLFSQDRLVIGLAGAVDAALEAKVKALLSALPATGAPRVTLPPLEAPSGKALLLQKDVLSTAISMGYPYSLRRGDPDFYAVAFALSYLGEHRQFNGVLFNELRELRGMNYGDYAYAEHFLQEGYGTYARTNIGRTQQELSIWIRPVEPSNGMFAARGAVYFLQRLLDQGIPQEKLELTRGFLTGYTRLWEQTDQRRLGYAIDDLFYGTPNFLQRYREAMKGFTPKSVLAAVRRHVDPRRLNYAFVVKDAAGLAKLLQEQPATPIQYPTEKPAGVLQEDEKIVVQPLAIDPEGVEIRDAQSFMER